VKIKMVHKTGSSNIIAELPNPDGRADYGIHKYQTNRGDWMGEIEQELVENEKLLEANEKELQKTELELEKEELEREQREMLRQRVEELEEQREELRFRLEEQKEKVKEPTAVQEEELEPLMPKIEEGAKKAVSVGKIVAGGVARLPERLMEMQTKLGEKKTAKKKEGVKG
jgi:DNA repair exonuclease SbcCD ATPase subunit